MVEPICHKLLKADIAFYPHNVLPFVFLSHGSFRVLVLHDVLFLDSDNRNAGNRYRSLKLRGSLFRADLIVTVSQASRDEILARLSPRCPVLVIPNALAEGFHAKADKPQREESSPARILHFGGSSPTKNTSNVLRAVALLNRRGFNVHLELAAMSERRDLVERWRQEAQLSAGSLTILPQLSDAELRLVYARADAHCMPSTGEGFGIPVVEAARIGTPNVVSPIEVFRELIGEDAIFTASLDAESIADGLLRCLSSDVHPMTQRAMKQAGRFLFDSVHAVYAVPAFQKIASMVDSRSKGASLSHV